jgi:hypothetical protein
MSEYVNRKEDIISDLAACKDAFDKAGVPWVILGGIVLGYARYKDIMAWDTDLDIGIFVELDDDKWHLLWDALNKNGFRFPTNRVDFMYCYRRVECNLELYHKDGEFYNCFPKSTPGIKFVEKSVWHDEHQVVDFLGSKYPIPNYVEDFVSAHYGPDWKTNIIKDHEQYFMEKRGGRDQSLWTKSRASKYGDLWPKALKLDDSMEVE